AETNGTRRVPSGFRGRATRDLPAGRQHPIASCARRFGGRRGVHREREKSSRVADDVHAAAVTGRRCRQANLGVKTVDDAAVQRRNQVHAVARTRDYHGAIDERWFADATAWQVALPELFTRDWVERPQAGRTGA